MGLNMENIKCAEAWNRNSENLDKIVQLLAQAREKGGNITFISCPPELYQESKEGGREGHVFGPSGLSCDGKGCIEGDR